MIQLLLLAYITLPHSADQQTQHVEVVELNHVLDNKGNERFQQIVIWRYYPHALPRPGRHCSEYFVLNDDEVPRLDLKGRHRRVIWRDEGRTFTATCLRYVETWTRGDPEMHDRKLYPMQARRPYFLKNNKGRKGVR